MNDFMLGALTALLLRSVLVSCYKSLQSYRANRRAQYNFESESGAQVIPLRKPQKPWYSLR